MTSPDIELPACFKAYDVRGRVPDELNEDFVRHIGRAYVQFTGAKRVAVGYDIRLSSPALSQALMRGLTEQGADVVDIGMGGTEEVYYATFAGGLDGGIMVTASHNPEDYNGLKFVREDARPISADNGLEDIGRLAVCGEFEQPTRVGKVEQRDFRPAYANFLIDQVDISLLKPLKIVTNAGNGGAGLVLDAIADRLPFEFIRLQHEPDGTFPHGVPNPLLPENRAATSDAVCEHGADMGIAWDGDFDRCFFFDERGEFIEGYYLVGLIASALLAEHPGEAIVYDPRLTWNTEAIIAEHGGTAVQSKSGHAFIKQVMREADAIYGGEMSAHHYFRDFAYCDNGQLPWLFIANLLCQTGKPLSALVAERMAAFPASGEINSKLKDPDIAIAAVESTYAALNPSINRLDGLSMDFSDWRFNLRKSNTEPVVRLNVEGQGDQDLMQQKTQEILAVLAKH